MRPVKTNTSNFVLIGKDENVVDLPVTRVQFDDGTIGVESCWELNDEELKEIVKTKRMYFCCLAPTHAPSALSVYSVIQEESKGRD